MNLREATIRRAQAFSAFATRWAPQLMTPKSLGWAVSFGFHTALLVSIGFVVVRSQSTEKIVATIDADWGQQQLIEPISEHAPAVTVLVEKSETSGGVNQVVELLSDSNLSSEEAIFGEQQNFQVSLADVASRLGPAKAAASSPQPSLKTGDKGGKGKGNGIGDGNGNGKGFFGIPPVGRRIVYVVDNSGSMNSPYEHQVVKTRFNRVRLELINSIGQMTEDNEFFVIFFNHETTMMPAEELQIATKANKEKYLRWTTLAQAGGGPTDPRDAITQAIRLGPEVIYFLTDGEFHPRINRDLMSLHQYRAKIHTFAFGSDKGEFVLKKVAFRNGGEYQFIR